MKQWRGRKVHRVGILLGILDFALEIIQEAN